MTELETPCCKTRDDESLDTALGGTVRIIQPRKGYRFSVEAVLLARFASGDGIAGRVFDLGSGSGVVGLCIKSLNQTTFLTGIDVQESCVERANRSAISNGWGDTARFSHCDVRDVPGRFKRSSAELVVSNPPFRSPDQSRVSDDLGLAVSRNELMGKLVDFTTAAAHLLVKAGSFCVVYPAGRLEYLVEALKKAGFALKEMRFIYPRSGEKASFVLIRALKSRTADLSVLPPLILHPDKADGGKYCEDVEALIGRPLS